MTRRGITAVFLCATTVAAGAAAMAQGTAAPAPERTSVRIFVPRGDAGLGCTRVHPLSRNVLKPAVLTGAMQALVAGPTVVERKRGYGGWFSRRTAGSVRSVRIVRGTAYVDLRDFSRAIPGASSSCGSTLLLAQLDRTALQFATVRRVVYSFDGSRSAFYEWLQRVVPPA